MKKIDKLYKELEDFQKSFDNMKSELIYVESKVLRSKRDIESETQRLKNEAWRTVYEYSLKIMELFPEHKMIKIPVAETADSAKIILGDSKHQEKYPVEFAIFPVCNDKDLQSVGDGCDRCNVLYAFRLIEKEIAKQYMVES